MIMMKAQTACVFAAVVVLTPLAAPAADKSIVFGLPGNPPVFLSVQEYVAAEAGLFRKYGVNVQLQPFDTGVAAARAVGAGDIEFTVSPTPVIVNLVGNSKVPLVGIYGLENPDWLIGASDPAIKTCKDLIGQSIGIDAPGGARSVALRQMTAPPPCSLQMEDIKQVALGSNTSGAMMAGQIKVGVLHLDDLAVIEDQLGKPINTVITLKRVKPISHYNLFAVRSDTLARDRDRYVRIIAALIDAEAFMRESKNWDRVAKIATATGRSPSEAKEALKRYLEFEFWPNGHDGLDERKIEAEIKAQVAVGGIQQGKEAPTYQKLIDRSVWRDALALTRKN